MSAEVVAASAGPNLEAMQRLTPTEQPYTEADFIAGTPERIMQATQHPKILVVWPHAGETLGPRVGHHIATMRPELLDHVDYLCGNPEAAAAGDVRDTKDFPEPVSGFDVPGTDLNRSFRPGHEPQSYEEHRAAKILALIEGGDYDYVLDLHTSISPVDRCFIISERFFRSPETIEQTLSPRTKTA